MAVRERQSREVLILRTAKSLPLRMETDPLLVIEESPANRRIDQFPELTDDKRVRFNPFAGDIYISVFREAPVRVQGRSSSEIVLFQRGENPQNISARRWNKYPDIETAIRGMEHVEEKYEKKGGQEVIKIKQVIGLMRDLLGVFRIGMVTEETLKDLEEKTIEGLAAAGFPDADKTIKQKLADQLLLASRKDSTDRINPLVSRSRIASAWVKATGELLNAKLIREKYSYLNLLLSNERDLERFHLEQASEFVNNILLRGLGNKEVERSLWNLRSYSSRYLGSGDIKVNPYRYPSMLAHVFLFGFQSDGQRRIIRTYSGSSETVKLLSQVKPVQELLVDGLVSREERFNEVSIALDFAKELYTGALETGDRNLKKQDSKSTK